MTSLPRCGLSIAAEDLKAMLELGGPVIGSRVGLGLSNKGAYKEKDGSDGLW